MEINELKNGDILLFSPEEGDFLSKAITILTDSCVSHAAMVFSSVGNEVDTTIIEETPPQIAVNNAQQRFVDRTIYVRRFIGNEDLNPVIDQSKKYLGQKLPYNMPEVYLLGILLIYKKLSYTSQTQKLVLAILKKLTEEIVKEIDKIKFNGQPAMICSEFVDNCYNEAGDDYKLVIKNGVLVSETFSKNLLDLAIDFNEANAEKVLTVTPMEDISYKSYEELCEALCESLESTALTTVAAPINKDLIVAVRNFLKIHHSIKNNLDTSSISFAKEDNSDFLSALKEDEAMFVFPGDLYDKCENLKDVGTIK